MRQHIAAHPLTTVDKAHHIIKQNLNEKGVLSQSVFNKLQNEDPLLQDIIKEVY